MLISDFDYELPEELIAQEPLVERDAARMLVLDRGRDEWRDSQFAELPSYVGAGDVVVVNNTRVFPARLVGRREPSGGRVELFLVRELEPLVWEALARPARRLHAGERVSFGGGRLGARVIELLEEGKRVVRFECEGALEDALEELGRTPLPPYIKRAAGRPDEDRERYQTVYARERGAIAAPTAGLHFTPRVMDELRARGATCGRSHAPRRLRHVRAGALGRFEPARGRARAMRGQRGGCPRSQRGAGARQPHNSYWHNDDARFRIFRGRGRAGQPRHAPGPTDDHAGLQVSCR